MEFGKIESEKVTEIPTANIRPFKERDRDPETFELLVESMGANGLLVPIVVSKNNDGKYDLMAGHGRLRAAKKLGWQKIKAVVKEQFSKLDFLVENYRQALTLYEKAVLMELEVRMGKAQKDICRMFSASSGQVSDAVKIIRTLNPRMKEYFKKGTISHHTAAKIARVAAKEEHQNAIATVIERVQAVKPQEVKKAVIDVLAAIKTKRGVESVEAFTEFRAKTKDEMENAKTAFKIIQNQWLLSVGELRQILKEPSMRKQFEKYGVDYKQVLG